MACRGRVWLVVVALSPAFAVGAERPAELNWNAWQHMPVYWQAARGSKIDGRMMPLNTVARMMVETVCGRVNPRLSLEGAAYPAGEAGSSALDEARQLFPDGTPRRFTAPELLFSWTVEPERWERVPFLVAENEELREDVLKLPVRSEDGTRLKYVSPWQIERATASIHVRLNSVAEEQDEATRDDKAIDVPAADRKLRELLQAYDLYRRLTFHPVRDTTGRTRFLDKFSAAIETWKEASLAWRRSEPDLERLGRLDPEHGPGAGLESVRKSMLDLSEVAEDRDVPLDEAEPLVVAIRKTTNTVAAKCAEQKAWLFEAATPPGWTEPEFKQACVRIHAVASQTMDLARQADELHRSLYDNGASLRLVPALNAAALETSRRPTDDTQLWLNLQTMIWGSDEVLAGYPRSEIEQVRSAFAEVARAYVDRGNPRRRVAFADSMDRFAASVRALGVAIEPARRKLPIQERDEELIALTAYPPPGSTRAEVHYYNLDPFFWSWVIGLVALVCFLIAFGAVHRWAFPEGVRKTAFWVGIPVLAAAQLFTLYGLGLRVYITGRAPVTNMFETVIFVALVVGVLGLWFTLLPFFWPGLRSAWRLTAIPFRGAAIELRPEATSPAGRGSWKASVYLLLPLRLALAVLTFLKLAWFPYSPEHARPFISLWPQAPVGSTQLTGNDLLVWVIGLCLLAMALWYIPRFLLTALLAFVTVPYGLVKHGVSQPLKEVASRKWFALSGASVGYLAAYVGYYAPIFDKDINPLMPVLRNNFWLTSHVLSITASYGAGALAWGLGLIALGCYLFGPYREGSGQSAAGSRQSPDHQSSIINHRFPARRRPPAICDTLGTFIYKATQVAVLLLVAGTILGGLWADVSWGRFWSWDPKEVWALISALVYLVVLHGRYAGWAGNFGLAVGSVLGATSILMAWYGVNYVLTGGRHTYGAGSGGLTPVLVIVAANWIFMGFAAARYLAETRAPRAAIPSAANPNAGR